MSRTRSLEEAREEARCERCGAMFERPLDANDVTRCGDCGARPRPWEDPGGRLHRRRDLVSIFARGGLK